MQLVERCYALTSRLPSTEQLNLGHQIRRAAVSIPANIAEGHRRTRRACVNHLSIALGSHAELETLLENGRAGLGFLDGAPVVDARHLTGSVGRQLHGLIRALEQA
jgi:four helix bundle protein